MKVFLGNFLLCFFILMLTVELILKNIWIAICVCAVVLAVIISVLYFQENKIETLEKRLEKLENKENS